MGYIDSRNLAEGFAASLAPLYSHIGVTIGRIVEM
jgi:hypothetical protein